MQSAIGHHGARRLADAEKLYRQALQIKPDDAGTLHLLGVACGQQGRLQEAVDWIGRAIAVAPHDSYYSNLGVFLTELGRHEEAIAALQRALQLQPDLGTYFNLGNALRGRGRLDEALAAYRQALALKPDFAEAHSNIASALVELERWDEALEASRAALQAKPNLAQAHLNLGVALAAKLRHDEAIGAYRQALRLTPGYAKAHLNLGASLVARGKLDEAMTSYRAALRASPNDAQAHHGLALALKAAGRLEEALTCFQRAAECMPGNARWHDALGLAYNARGELEPAIAAYRRAVELKPDFAQAQGNLCGALRDLGRIDEAVAQYRAALEHNPASPSLFTGYLFTLNVFGDGAAVAGEARRWAARFADPLRAGWLPHLNDASPARRLRIGYVSPNFSEHSVSRFLLPLLTAHDRPTVEIYCYSELDKPDATTQRLRQHADHWHPTVDQSDDQLAATVRADAIDILIDLAGHTAGNRLLVFARKPAPVQVTWLGSPATTGLAAIDYRLTDPLADPPGMTEAQNTEKLWRLPRTNWCFGAPSDAPDVTPRDPGAGLVFASFNHLAKISTDILALWAKILQQVPSSKLLLKSKGFSAPAARHDIARRFGDLGIAEDRLDLQPWRADRGSHLGVYGGVDIALDTFPYHGTTTTCEALWMGLPVVTLAGTTHVSRVGVSLLTNVGLADMLAATGEDYVAIAARLAADPQRRAALRSTLRDRMRQSPLMDAATFARDLESAYRQMWQQWCAARTSGT